MNGTQNTSQAQDDELSTFKLYLAAALGAFCLGFGDLLNNSRTALDPN